MEFSEAEVCLSANAGASAPPWRSYTPGNSSTSRVFSEFLAEFQQSSCMILIYCFIMYLLYVYLGNRFERARERDILREHKKLYKAEQDAFVKLKNLERASSAKRHFRGPRDTHLPSENIQHFVSLSMFPIGAALCSYFFEQIPKDVKGMLQICKLGEDKDHYIAQTQIELTDDVLMMLIKLAEQSLDNSSKSLKILQLGKFQVYLRPHDQLNRVEQLKIEETESVPVVLHATYEAGTVTIYGYGLTGASLMLATSTKCIILKTMSQRGVNGLEKHTCLVTPPSKNTTEVFVYATKNIDVQEHEVCVSSLIIPLQDGNWRVVFRNVIPVMIILLYAAIQILCAMHFIYRTTSASLYIQLLLPVLAILLTQLPKSAELTFRKWCQRMCKCSYWMLYFAYQSLVQECDSQISSPSFPKSGGKPGKKHLSHKRSDVSDSENSDDDSDDNQNSKIRNPDWQWPKYDLVQKSYQSRLVRRNSHTRDRGRTPFKVIYRNRRGLPWASQVQVEILSLSLVRIINDLMPDKVDLLNQTSVKLSGPELFFIYQKLKDLLDSKMKNPLGLSTPGHTIITEEILHLKHLLRFLDQELKTIEEMHASMKSQRSLSHDMLWAFFPPGEVISYECVVTNEDCCGVVDTTYYIMDDYDKLPIFYINISVYDYNCRKWSKYLLTREMDHFEGYRIFDDMKIYPLSFKDNHEELKTKFLKHGRLFCELSMQGHSNFQNYKGSLFKMVLVDKCWRVRKENADGRVMIDLGSFSKMNPDYNLKTALPPCDVIRDNTVETIDISNLQTRMFSPAMVYGFSFRLKQWGSFSICGFSNIAFNDSAFESLVMDATKKDLTESMVKEHISRGLLPDSERLDPIGAKGDGCIILCYGPPGTGKTLTAESLAEKLHRPLWSLSVAQLGTTPVELESMLVKIMDVAVQWRALLLLDEADVYLEQRSSSDLTRNAMTGVFLRQLEYFHGVIFLTTNRDIAFDDAFCSRICIFLHYEKLSKSQRVELWQNHLARVGMTNVPPEVLERIVEYEFNGREIRNVMQTARSVARSKKEQINHQHILRSLAVLDSSLKHRAFLNSQIQEK